MSVFNGNLYEIYCLNFAFLFVVILLDLETPNLWCAHQRFELTSP